MTHGRALKGDDMKIIRRYSDSERVNHWLVAICFVLAALSGLAFFHPAFAFLVHLFGGGPWARILHPFIGVVMFLAFLLMMLRYWHANTMDAGDKQWLRQWRDVVANREDRLPEVGRYNAGQKAMFWLMVICMIVLVITGIMFWRPWFAGFLPISLVRLASLLHAIAATVLIIGVIVHVYAGIWVKGSIGAMLRGTVTERWARKHHAAWFREINK
ncbi:MAG: formate dehydrogenase subunit gamma [Betaproteobacteria bacterium]